MEQWVAIFTRQIDAQVKAVGVYQLCSMREEDFFQIEIAFSLPCNVKKVYRQSRESNQVIIFSSDTVTRDKFLFFSFFARFPYHPVEHI